MNCRFHCIYQEVTFHILRSGSPPTLLEDLPRSESNGEEWRYSFTNKRSCLIRYYSDTFLTFRVNLNNQ